MKKSVQRSESQLATVAANSGRRRGAERSRRNANPVAVMSMPLRLSGRRRHAISPHAAKDPPTRRRTTSTGSAGPSPSTTGASTATSATAATVHSATRTPRRGSAAATRSTSPEPPPLRDRRNRVARHRSRRSVARARRPAGRSSCRSTVDRAKAGPESPREPTPHRPIGGQRAAGSARRSAAAAAGATRHARRSSTTTARARANQSTPTSQSMRAASLPVKPSAP